MKRKDIMKPVPTQTDGKMSFEDFSKSIPINSGFGVALNKEKPKDQFGGKVPPFSRSELLKRGYLKKA